MHSTRDRYETQIVKEDITSHSHILVDTYVYIYTVNITLEV